MAIIETTEETVGEIVRRLENDYISGTGTRISEFVWFDQYRNINKIDAYINSQHISGDVDSMGREKPFFNIVTGARNIWYRATDIDRKDIRIKPTNSKTVVPAFLATVHLQNWMRQENFGVFLNDWGLTLATYGSAVVKFVEKGGRLHSQVVPWNRLISDSVDFENNPKIEVLELTEAQLRKNKSYDQKQVDALCNATRARQLLNRQQQDNKANYVKLYEIHMEASVATLKMAQGKEPTEADYDNYVQQMHVVSFVADDMRKGEYSDFTLVSGRETRDPYMITHLIKEDGRSMAIGSVEHLFEAQWMQNHSVKAMKDQLDLASKLIFQTSDGNFVGQNALTAIENGDIMIHEINQPLTAINNQSHDITSLQNFAGQWKALAQEITSTPDALRGTTPPSGTPYSSIALLGQQANSLFEVMTENKGLSLEDMIRIYVIPFIKKRMDSKDEIAATLEDYDIKKLDQMYLPKVAVERYNDRAKRDLIEGKIPEAFDPASAEGAVKSEMDTLGNQRFLDPEDVSWETWMKDLDWDEVEVEITNEQQDKQAVLTTLNTLFQTIMAKQGQPMSPDERLVFNKILAATGQVSALELGQVASTPVPAPIPQGNPSPVEPEAPVAQPAM